MTPYFPPVSKKTAYGFGQPKIIFFPVPSYVHH